METSIFNFHFIKQTRNHDRFATTSLLHLVDPKRVS